MKRHGPKDFPVSIHSTSSLWRKAAQDARSAQQEKDCLDRQAQVPDSIVCFEVHVKGTWYDVHRLKNENILILQMGGKIIRRDNKRWKDVMRAVKARLDKFEVEQIMEA